MVFCIVLTILLIALGLLESRRHRKNLDKVPVRILVNGTRGKTTVARLLVAALNEAGIPTMGRTTGSEAEYIFPDGHVEPFVRRRAASILEMKSVFARAVKENVSCVVVECMALRPENQKVIARTLVRPTHVVITNTFIDHVAEMGPSLEETAYALGLSVPEGCQVFVTEDLYSDLKAKVHKVSVTDETIDAPIDVHPSNYALVKAVVEHLGLDASHIANGAKTIRPDVGLHGTVVAKGGAALVPTFSVNDLTCMDQAVKRVASENPGKRIWLVFNNRADREYRIQLMDKVLERNRESLDGVVVIGDYTWKVCRHFSRLGISSERLDVETLKARIDAADSNDVFVGLGNIKGSGEELVKSFLEETD